MARQETRSLFGEPDDGPSDEVAADAPLAERMRPRSLDEYVGQGHLVGEGRLVRRLVDGGGPLPSLILWGGPGTGKTTARKTPGTPGEGAIRAVVGRALGGQGASRGDRRGRGRRGAAIAGRSCSSTRSTASTRASRTPSCRPSRTGPSRSSAPRRRTLHSRSTPPSCPAPRVLTLQPLSDAEIADILRRAMADPERGLSTFRPVIADEDLARLATASSGDARVALTALESSVLATEPGEDGLRRVDRETLVESVGRARYAYDKGGEEHFNLVSALIKSLRNSDANAALYWLARLIEGGADPVFHRPEALHPRGPRTSASPTRMRCSRPPAAAADRPVDRAPRGALSALPGRGLPRPRPEVERDQDRLLRRRRGRRRDRERARPDAPPQRRHPR